MSREIYDDLTYEEIKGSLPIEVNDFDATDGQTIFEIDYSIGKLEVFYEGIKLRSNQYTADNGTSVILNDSASDGDWISIKTW